MKCVTIIVLLCASAWTASAQTMPELRKELLQMEERDQSARIKCMNGTADQQSKCLMKIAEEIDTPNTKRISEILISPGFPTAEMVGRDGVNALVTMLQHVRSTELRGKSEAGMRQAFKDKVITPSQYTGFVDRLLMDQGKPQRYGSNFQTKDGKFVMTPVEDPKNLEKRRKEMGLPTMAEYMKMLKDAYKLEVEMPPSN